MAERQLIQLFTASTGDAVAAFDVPEDGELVGVDWDLRAQDMDTSGDRIDIQLSFLTTSQFATNDARGVISNTSLMANGSEGTATDPAVASSQKYVTFNDPGLKLSGGERIYIHAAASTGVVFNVRCIVHLAVGKAIRRARRRR